eukprot:COSAG01_NODE_1422_length_10360_cov_36.853815_11_plen_69_part_00
MPDSANPSLRAAAAVNIVPCNSFIKQYLNASNTGEIETLKAELDKVKEEKAALEAEVAQLKAGAAPEQ